MPYTWETPIADRTSESYYNYTDPNRVDNNSRYLKQYVNTYLGYTITLSAYSTQVLNSLPTVALINLLEHNINQIKDAAGTPTGWVALLETWEAGVKDTFIYSDANNLEQDQTLLKTMIELIVASVRYCGQANFYSGNKLTAL